MLFIDGRMINAPRDTLAEEEVLVRCVLGKWAKGGVTSFSLNYRPLMAVYGKIRVDDV